MIITLLTMMVVWCMLYKVVPTMVLLAVSVTVAVLSALTHRHGHEGVLDIDCIAQRSKLNTMNPMLKFWSALLLMFLCVGADTPFVGVFLAVSMLLVSVGIGKVRFADYMSLLATPTVFLVMSSLALLFDLSLTPHGIIDVPIFGRYLSVSAEAQAKTILLMAKAMGSISCLYFLSLSTPMADVISVMRKSKVPGIVIELMYLIYRYTFILFDMHRSMKAATASRLGYVDFRTAVRTTGQLYAHLLARSYRRANINFDAMESRCYTGNIQFFEQKKEIGADHIFAVCVVIVIASTMTFARM